MSKFIEIRPNTLINLDNVKFVHRNNAVNGGVPSLIITYMDCTGQPMPFHDRVELDTAYNRIKNSNND